MESLERIEDLLVSIIFLLGAILFALLEAPNCIAITLAFLGLLAFVMVILRDRPRDEENSDEPTR